MLKKNSFTALFLLICIISLSSCSLLRGSKLKPVNVIRVFEEEGFEEVDIDDIIDDLEDAYYSDDFSRDLENGVYATATTKNDIRKIFDSANGLNIISEFYDYDNDMKEACWFVRAEMNSAQSGAIVGAVAFRMEGRLAGNDSDILDEILENLEDVEGQLDDEVYDNYEYDAGRENGVSNVRLAFEMRVNDYDYDVNVGFYCQNRYMFLVYSIDIDSTRGVRQVDDICDMLDLPSPSEL